MGLFGWKPKEDVLYKSWVKRRLTYNSRSNRRLGHASGGSATSINVVIKLKGLKEYTGAFKVHGDAGLTEIWLYYSKQLRTKRPFHLSISTKQIKFSKSASREEILPQQGYNIGTVSHTDVRYTLSFTLPEEHVRKFDSWQSVRAP